MDGDKNHISRKWTIFIIIVTFGVNLGHSSILIGKEMDVTPRLFESGTLEMQNEPEVANFLLENTSRDLYVLVTANDDYPNTNRDWFDGADNINALLKFFKFKLDIPEENVYSLYGQMASRDGILDKLTEIGTHLDEDDILFFSWCGQSDYHRWTETTSVSLESAHNYSTSQPEEHVFAYPNATDYKLTFDRIEMASGDRLIIEDSVTQEPFYLISGNRINFTTNFLSSSNVTVRIQSNNEDSAWGYAISSVETQYVNSSDIRILPNVDWGWEDISNEDLNATLNAIPGKQILLLDTSKSETIASQIINERRIILGASGEDQQLTTVDDFLHGDIVGHLLSTWEAYVTSEGESPRSIDEIFLEAQNNYANAHANVIVPVVLDGIPELIYLKPYADVTIAERTEENHFTFSARLIGIGVFSIQATFYDYDEHQEMTYTLVSEIISNDSQTSPTFTYTEFENFEKYDYYRIGFNNSIPGWMVADVGLFNYSGNILKEDADGDGLTDYEEMRLGLKIWNNDTDSDGIDDGWEVLMNLDPFVDDSNDMDDGDDLTNYEEYLLGTDPFAIDSDHDDIDDDDEIALGLNPTDSDTDNDGWSDGIELRMKTDPLKKDTDGDGMNDLDEWLVGRDPLKKERTSLIQQIVLLSIMGTVDGGALLLIVIGKRRGFVA